MPDSETLNSGSGGNSEPASDGARIANARESVRQDAIRATTRVSNTDHAVRAGLIDVANSGKIGKRVVMAPTLPRPDVHKRTLPKKALPEADSLRDIRAMNKRDIPVDDKRPHCKTRPNNDRKGGGGGKGFVPWC